MTFSIRMMARVFTLALLAMPLFGGLSPLSAHEYKAGALMIEHPWARATPGHAKNGAAFVKIVNHGTAPDRLMGAESGVAERVELHTHINENGVMKMRPSGPIEVPMHGEVALQPGSYHIMMIGLKHPLKEGDLFPMTLLFEKAGPVKVEVKIEAVGAGAGAGMKMDHGTMNHGSGMKMKSN